MPLLRTFKRAIQIYAPPLYRPTMVPFRLMTALRHTCAGVGQTFKWSVTSREDTNFTYDLTQSNLNVLAQLLSVITGRDPAVCGAYIDEVMQDADLRSHIVNATLASRFHGHTDQVPRFARRVGWYAIVRLMRPRVIVETGVDKGLGSVLLCSALLRNRGEGFPGKYYGTDINPDAGWLLSGQYSEVGKILYGDSINSLRQLPDRVDLLINDSDHSAEYEAREYETVVEKLSNAALILSDNAHVSDALERFSRITGRSYLYFHEQPQDHWYRGAGIGFSFIAAAARGNLS